MYRNDGGLDRAVVGPADQGRRKTHQGLHPREARQGWQEMDQVNVLNFKFFKIYILNELINILIIFRIYLTAF